MRKRYPKYPEGILKMKKTVKNMIIIIPSLLLIYFIVNTYYVLNGGTPWGKYQFKSEVEDYIKSKYPDLNYKIDSVYYSFKEMQYSAYVNSGISSNRFYVTQREGYGLWDNYPHVLWSEEATRICMSILDNHTSEAICKVDLAGSGGINNVKQPFPSYADVQEKLYSSMQLDVKFNRKITEDDYELILKIKGDLEKAKISNQMSYLFKDVSFFNIGQNVDSITKLKKNLILMSLINEVGDFG